MRLFKHIPALFTSFVWGTTFAVSKLALSSGISPILLMTARFVVAYLALWIVYHQYMPLQTFRTEFLFFLLGVCGGSLYFLAEYYALHYTSAVNVGIITSTVPLLSTLLLISLRLSKPSLSYFFGSFVAFAGVVIVVLNGQFTLHFSLIGDMLALAATLLWAVYSVVLARLGKFHPLFVSRRLFFYALLTISPFAIAEFQNSDSVIFYNPNVLFPILYLGLFASCLCIVLWNVSVNRVGAVLTNNYLYLMTIIPIFASSVFFNTEITRHKIIGSLLVLIGVLFANLSKSIHNVS